jgi:hypothetical protein
MWNVCMSREIEVGHLVGTNYIVVYMMSTHVRQFQNRDGGG